MPRRKRDRSPSTIPDPALPPPLCPPLTTAVCVAIVGFGAVGKELFSQLAERRAYLRERLGVSLRVVAVSNSRRVAVLGVHERLQDLISLDGTPQKPGETPGWRALLERPACDGAFAQEAGWIEPPETARLLGAHVCKHALVDAWSHQIATRNAQSLAAVGVVVDATASDEVAGFYGRWVRAGAHVATANKRMGSGPLARLDALLDRLVPVVSFVGDSDEDSGTERAPPSEETPSEVDEDKRARVSAQGALLAATGRMEPPAGHPDPPRSPRFLYEATVGAGLPVLSTLRALVETGDEVESIEGVLSGTLSFIFSTFEQEAAKAGSGGGGGGGKTFSAVVAEARALGYTEPDPRDDLSGADVARKAVILAREAGVRLELEGVGAPPPPPADGAGAAAGATAADGDAAAGRGGRGGRVRGRGGRGGSMGAAAASAAADAPAPSAEPLLLVPPSLSQASGASVQQFMDGLPSALDARMHQLAAAAASRGAVLRHAARVDVRAGTAVAGVQEFSRGHPFASLQGTDNLVRFVTRRYPGGLVVRGPGAGAAVTAAGVVGDVLAVARSAGRVYN